MPAEAVRNWLGLYVLGLTAFVGTYFFVAPGALVPLETPDKIASTEIIVPFLLGQMAAVFRFYSAPTALKARYVGIPVWVVKGPPIVVTGILLVEFVLMGIGGTLRNNTLLPAPESFKAALTFCVAFLNASTVFVITRYFETDVHPSASPAITPGLEH